MAETPAMPMETDAAKELYDLCRHMGRVKANPSNMNAAQMLPMVFGIATEPHGPHKASAEMFELVSVVKARFVKLADFVKGLPAGTFEEEIRVQGLQSIREVSGFLEPIMWSNSWDSVRAEIENKASLHALLGLSGPVRRVRPLRLLAPQELDSQRKAAAELTQRLDAAGDLPPWTKSVLADALKRLELVLRHFQFFGVEGLIGVTIQTAERLQTCETTAAKEAWSKSSWFKTAAQVLRGLAMAARCVNTAHEWAETGVWLYDLYTTFGSTLPALPAPLKQLPPPSGTLSV